MVEPDEEGVITMTFTAPEQSDGLRFQAQLLIENNSAVSVIEVPVTLEVGEQSIADEVLLTLPVDFVLGIPYPNPFNARTVIPVELPVKGRLSAVVYDLSGRRVFELASGSFEPGRYELAFSAGDLASGVYLVRVKYRGQRAVRKVVLLR